MRAKRRLTVITSLLLSLTVLAGNDIQLMANPTNDHDEDGRAVCPTVTASIDGSTITLDLAVLAGVEYCVTDETTGTEICCSRFPAGAVTEFDLPANTASGTYRIEVYAYGCFWTGTFIK